MKKTLLAVVLVGQMIVSNSQTSMKPVMTDKMPGINCDNTVHNTLPTDALNRSPSECEKQFDWKTRTALRDAFQKALMNFPETEWIIADTAVEVLKEVGKETEQNFFNISYYFKIDLSPHSPAYKDWYDRYQAQMDALKSPKDDAYKKFTAFIYQMNSAIHIKFYVLVNDVGRPIYFLKGGQQAFSVPGAAYAVKGPYVAPLSGGSVDDSHDGCLILFGKSAVSVKKETDGTGTVNVKNSFPKNISHLTVQNVSIRIECNDELLNKIINNTDFQAISDLLGK